jgi:hypothetical protein
MRDEYEIDEEVRDRNEYEIDEYEIVIEDKR